MNAFVKSASLKAIREYLSDCQPSADVDIGRVETLLSQCWHELEGGETESMEGYKLHGRMENVSWQPPKLSFNIERHGGTVLGSSRAGLHEWTINVDTGAATCDTSRFRQIGSKQPAFKAQPIADEIVSAINEGKQDPQIKWLNDKTVNIEIGEVLPAGSAVNETLAGRRKRLRNAVTNTLEPLAWKVVRPNVYARNE